MQKKLVSSHEVQTNHQVIEFNKVKNRVTERKKVGEDKV